MHTCEFCGSLIPEYASFCGQCGRVFSKATGTSTIATDFRTPDAQNIDIATIASVSGNFQPDSGYNQQTFISNISTTLLSEDEEEEERRRRAALLGMGAPLLGSMVVEGMPNAGNVPTVQGTPLIGEVPTVQGTPYSPAASIGQGLYAASPTDMAPQLPASIPVSPLPATTITSHQPHDPQHPHHPQQPHPSNHPPLGCSLAFILAAIILPILIILSFLGLGLTLFAPSLSLSGSTTVVQGGTFTLYGSHFIPGSNVTLTLDNTLPLYFSSGRLPFQSAQSANTSSMQILASDTQVAKQSVFSKNTVSVGGDGTFAVTIMANPDWSIGKHTIIASEAPTHRSTSLDFTIYLAGTTPTSTLTESTSPTPSLTTTYTPTATVTATIPGLSCINPSTLALGPVLQGSTQAITSQVTLCTSGTGAVNWTATWDQNAAPWLQLDHTSGQISAPGQAQVAVSALASNLSPGNYAVTVAFTSQPDHKTQSLQISFTVQGGCASGNPNTLTYSGIANVSDPAAQAVTISNCGPPGTWSASIQTNNGGNWLFANPTGGKLNTGASSNAEILASNLKAQLAAGTYTGNIIFKIGVGTFTVKVKLTVMPAPTLAASPTLIFANRQCTIDPTGSLWICTVSITNNSTTLSLHWSANSSSLKGINFNPSNGTVSPARTMQVQFSVPQSDCPMKGILSFTGPANTASVEWYCIAG